MGFSSMLRKMLGYMGEGLGAWIANTFQLSIDLSSVL